ncbi:LysR family transcriptional regulator [Eoetvoesiella caeni]|uniref:LysR family transcriptional regulator n=1 Tax=Eoetvoesiella caeni TaxID=645616 RepID=A0A366HG68_9BURK|nr:LysR family transcriptional regulator [Eoetvoesiella caeni]MCI2807740.1 LysR family transcriptional regulator [Eoetvoesiella caeni]NYT54255.1 LysR family transcriptional regulator [Eoetvoesiella caeni]RBP41655.1 LysR family transcriptional regulator [Eoetvoesiella caeni]
MRGFDTRFTLQKLEVFCVVAELQSITRASEFLCVTQPVVTSHIQTLEDKLGAKLIRREGRGIVLTAAGLRALKWAQEIVTRTHELERELSGSAPNIPGAVIASSMSVGSYQLPGIICDFQASHPDGLVKLSISNPHVALEATRTGECDFAVVIISPDQNLDGLALHPLWDEPLLLVSAVNSQWVPKKVQRDQISQLPFISTNNSSVMQKLEEGQLRANGITSRRVIMALGHPEAQKEAVRRDVGVCFFFKSSVIHDVDRGDLQPIETPGLAMSIPLYLVHRKDKELSLFQEELKQHIKSARPAGVIPFKDRQEIANLSTAKGTF